MPEVLNINVMGFRSSSAKRRNSSKERAKPEADIVQLDDIGAIPDDPCDNGRNDNRLLEALPPAFTPRLPEDGAPAPAPPTRRHSSGSGGVDNE